MKKLIFISILFLSSILWVSFTCTNGKFIDKGLYQVCYSEDLRSPLVVEYKLWKPIIGNAERAGMNFIGEQGTKTAGAGDFVGNDYDKGHLAPAEDFSDSLQHIEVTFNYVNCTLQHYKLNRGAWKSLEAKVRHWADSDSVMITNYVIFDKGFKRLKSGTAIPTKFQKQITFLTSKKVVTYEFPNKDCNKALDKYILKQKGNGIIQ